MSTKHKGEYMALHEEIKNIGSLARDLIRAAFDELDQQLLKRVDGQANPSPTPQDPETTVPTPTPQDQLFTPPTKYESELASTAAILQAAHPVGNIKSIGLLEVAKATKEMALRMLELEELIHHIQIHADMNYTYRKMGMDEQELYDSVVGHDLEELCAKMDVVREAER